MLSLCKSVPIHYCLLSVPSTCAYWFSFGMLPMLAVTLSYHITSYGTPGLKTLSLTGSLNLSGFFFVTLSRAELQKGSKTDLVAHIGCTPLVLCKSLPNPTVGCQ